jgi:hypothetical protein
MASKKVENTKQQKKGPEKERERGERKEKRKEGGSKLDVLTDAADEAIYFYYWKIHLGEGSFTWWKNR